jgi:hypothetical protein
MVTNEPPNTKENLCYSPDFQAQNILVNSLQNVLQFSRGFFYRKVEKGLALYYNAFLDGSPHCTTELAHLHPDIEIFNVWV